MLFFTPLALASFVALPLPLPLLLALVIMVWLCEVEKLLRRELPGYAAYCERVRCRLAPGLW